MLFCSDRDVQAKCLIGIWNCNNLHESHVTPFLLSNTDVYFARIENLSAADLVFLQFAPMFALYLDDGRSSNRLRVVARCK